MADRTDRGAFKGPRRVGTPAYVAALTAFALTFLCAPAAARADAEPGNLDTSFGGNGTVTTAFTGSGGAFATDVDFRSGRLAAVGGDGGGRFALGIYRQDGSLAFDRVTTNFGSRDTAFAVAITPGLGMIAAGESTSTDRRLALAKYFGFGGLNPTFGDAGKVLTPIEDGASAYTLALQTDGRIIVAGERLFSGIFDVELDFTIVRYDPDGSLDASFDGNGIRVFRFGDLDSRASAVAVQADRKIVAAGSAYVLAGETPERFAVARVNPDGSLDRGFSDDGKLTEDFAGLGGEAGAEANAVAVQPDGKIIAAGRVGGFFGLARYRTNGSLDPAFGAGGTVVTSIGTGNDRAEALAIQPDGKILVAGRTAQGAGNVALARYLPNGTLDPSFGDGGRVITGLGGDESASGIAIQDDGRIVIAGKTSTGEGRFLLARYHAERFDDTPPSTSILSGPPPFSNNTEPELELSASEPESSFECALEGDGFEPCSKSHTLGPLADGPYTFLARATDAAGNTDATPARIAFLIDTVAPETLLDEGPAGQTNDPSPIFAFSSSEPGTRFECSIHATAFEACESPLAVGPLTDGAYTFLVRAIDRAGNTDTTPEGRSFTVATTRPGNGDNGGTGAGGTTGGNASTHCPRGTSRSVTCEADRRGRTVFRGTRGSERFVGTPGEDLMFGAGGRDRMHGRAGNDDLRGGKGADRLTGGPGRDTFLAGRGNDKINAKGQRRELVNCGEGGRDRVKSARGDRVRRNCEKVRRR